jgi:hypothetical protein
MDIHTQPTRSMEFWSEPGPGIFTPDACKRWDAARAASEREYSIGRVANMPYWETLLIQMARMFFRAAVVAVAISLPFVVFRIIEAVVSGRVQQILDQIQKAGQ